MYFNIKKFLAVVPLVLCLQCGGNSGGGSGGSGVVGSIGGGILSIGLLGTTPISQTSPSSNIGTLVSPISGSIRIPNGGIEIHLQASAELNSQTVNTNTFVLYENGNALAQHLYSVNLYDQNTKIAIIPDYQVFQFKDNIFYRLEVTNEVKGMNNEELQASLNFEFQAPSTLSVPLLNLNLIADGVVETISLPVDDLSGNPVPDGTVFDVTLSQGAILYNGGQPLTTTHGQLEVTLGSEIKRLGRVMLGLESQDGFYKGQFPLRFNSLCDLSQNPLLDSGVETSTADPLITGSADYIKTVLYLDIPDNTSHYTGTMAVNKTPSSFFDLYSADTAHDGPIHRFQGNCQGVAFTANTMSYSDPDGLRSTEDGLFISGSGTTRSLKYNKSVNFGSNINELSTHYDSINYKTLLFAADNSGDVYRTEFVNQTFQNTLKIYTGNGETSVAYNPFYDEVYIARRNIPLTLHKYAAGQVTELKIANQTFFSNMTGRLANINRINFLFFNRFDHKLYISVTGSGLGSQILRVDPTSQNPIIEEFVLLTLTSKIKGAVTALDVDEQGNLYGSITDDAKNNPNPSVRSFVIFPRFNQ